MSQPLSKRPWNLFLIELIFPSRRKHDDDDESNGRVTTLSSWLLLISGAGCLYNFWYRRLKRRKEHLPFHDIPHHIPNPHWLLGHLPCLGANVVQGQETLCRTFAGAGDQQISTFFVLHVPTLSTLNAGLARRLLQVTSERRPPAHQRLHFGKLFGQHSILLQNGAQWKQSRALAHKVFKATNLQSNSSLQRSLWTASARVERALQQSIRQQQQTQTQAQQVLYMDGVDLARMAALDVFGLVGLGHDFGCTATNNGQKPCLVKSPIFEHTTFLQSELTRRCFTERFNLTAQLYEWPGNEANRRHCAATKVLRETLQQILRRRRAELMNKPAQEDDNVNDLNLVDSLLQGYQVSHNMKDDVLSDWMVTMLFGGYDTTALSLSFCFYLLATHDAIQTHCAREAQGVLVRRKRNGQDDNKNDWFSTMEEVDIARDCPYIWACIWEALRLYPPATLTTRNLIRPFTFDMNVDGKATTTKSVTLETNTRIMFSFYWIHRSSCNFPRPHEFLPERWVQRKSTTKQQSGVSEWEERHPGNDLNQRPDVPVGNRANHLAFSAGARNCVGQALASKMLPTVLAMIVGSTRIELQDPLGYQMKLVRYGGNAAPANGIPMKFSKRESLAL